MSRRLKFTLNITGSDESTRLNFLDDLHMEVQLLDYQYAGLECWTDLDYTDSIQYYSALFYDIINALKTLNSYTDLSVECIESYGVVRFD